MTEGELRQQNQKPLCKDCQHFDREVARERFKDPLSIPCQHPSGLHRTLENLVVGGLTRHTCGKMRTDTAMCGMGGRLFQRRDG